MLLKPQDIVVALKLALPSPEGWTYVELGRALLLSPAEVHNATRRAVQARLLMRVGRQAPTAVRGNLLEFLVHGAKYSFPPDRTGLTRGFPTAHAAPGLMTLFAATDEPPPVWPNARGPVRGHGFSPLYRTAAKAAKADEALYRLLAAVDLLRGGGARERKVGTQVLADALGTGDGA